MDQCSSGGGVAGSGSGGGVAGSGSGGRKQQRHSPFTSPAEGRSGGSSSNGAAAAEKAEKARGLSSSGKGFPATATADGSPLRTSSAAAAANNSSLSTSTSGIAKSPNSPKPGSSGMSGNGSLVPPLPPPPQPRVSLLDMRSPVFNRRSGSPSPPVRLQQLQQQEVAFPVGNSPARNPVLANALGTPSPSVHLLGPDAAAGTPMSATSSLHFGPAGNYATFDARDDDAEVNLTAGVHSPRNPPAGSRAAEDAYIDPEIRWSDDKRTVHAYMSLWATSSFRGEAVASDSDDIEDSSTRWLVLDFSAVLGMDATAARVCFLMLKQLRRASGVTLVFAGLGPKIRAVLQAHVVVQPDEPRFSTLDGALEWCEEQLLASVRAAAPVNSMAHTNKRSNFGTTKAAAAAAAAAGSIGKERGAAAAQAFSDDKVNGRKVLPGDSKMDKKGVIRRDRLQQQAPLSAVLSVSAKAKQGVNSQNNGSDGGGFGSSEAATGLAGEATSSATAAARKRVVLPGENNEDDIFDEEENQENSEERADSSERDDPFGRHPSYYDKARQLRQGSNSDARNSSVRSSRSRSSEEAENRESKEGDEDEDCVGGPHAILQDYLELEPHGPPTRVGQLLLAATDFFQEEANFR